MADQPKPVEVKNPNPIPVEITESKEKSKETDSKAEARIIAAKAAVDANVLVKEDQRRISRIWERTQQVIALAVVLATLSVSSFKAVFDTLQDPERGIAAGPAFLFLVGASNLVIGFYFGRTNHQKTGGGSTTDPLAVNDDQSR